MKAGYSEIDEVYSRNNNDGKWKKIWSKDGLPKINIFFWILGHGKTLTTDYLRKGGLEGPLRCILCKECEESLQHLFLECKFFREVWHQAYKEPQFELTLSTNWDDIFVRWKDYYQGSLLNKPYFARAWDALPRYICWKIWTTRNKEIFEGEKNSPSKVASTAKALWVQALCMKGMNIINNEALIVEERDWVAEMLFLPSH